MSLETEAIPAGTLEDPAGQRTVEETPEIITNGLREFKAYFPQATIEKCAGIKEGIAHEDDFIVRFLRSMKFDAERACDLYIRYCAKRTELFGDCTSPLRFSQPDVRKVADLQVVCALQGARDHWGRQILYGRMALADYKIITPEAFLKYMWVQLDFVLNDEQTQKNGVIMFQNLHGVSRKNFNQTTAKLLIDSVQNFLPVRMAGIFVLNPPLYFKIMFGVIRMFMKTKMKKRVRVVGHDYGEIHKWALKASIPEDLGGTCDYDHAAFLRARFQTEESMGST